MSLAPNLGLAWVAWVTGMACFKGGGRGRGGIAGASSENINPSIWRVMAAFEISPYRSILSTRARSVRWQCERWAVGGLPVQSCIFVLQTCPRGICSGNWATRCARTGSRAPTSPPFTALQAHKILGGGKKLGCIFLFRLFSFFSFYFAPLRLCLSPPPPLLNRRCSQDSAQETGWNQFWRVMHRDS